MKYEVDLRRRKDGNSVETIYSGGKHDKAWDMTAKWNKDNIPDYDEKKYYESYVDGSEGLFADVYEVEE